MMRMTWIVAMIAGVCMVLAPSETFPRHGCGGCDHVHEWYYLQSRCSIPGQDCVAPCGGDGKCVTTNWWGRWGGARICKCVQVSGRDTNFVTAGGLHLTSVTPSDTVPYVGSTFTFSFDNPDSMDEVVFILGDESLTELGHLFGEFSGELVITFDAEDTEHVYGVIDTFYLDLPSHQFFGYHTGENHWALIAESLRGVTYHKGEDGYTLETDQSLVLTVTNDLGTEATTGWITLAISFSEQLPEGTALVLTTEANKADVSVVPSLSEWALLALAALILFVGVAIAARRRIFGLSRA